MNQIDKEINEIIMNEMGLDIGLESRIYDQDTMRPIEVNGMKVMAPGVYGGKQSVEFDPYNNRKQMSYLFSYYTKKFAEENGKEVIASYAVDDDNGKGKIECRLENNEIISSGSYQRDTLKYADMIMKMNGDPNPSQTIAKYDVPFEKKEPAPKKKTTKATFSKTTKGKK